VKQVRSIGRPLTSLVDDLNGLIPGGGLQNGLSQNLGHIGP
jgi:hypothetical protein